MVGKITFLVKSIFGEVTFNYPDCHTRLEVEREFKGRYPYRKVVCIAVSL